MLFYDAFHGPAACGNSLSFHTKVIEHSAAGFQTQFVIIRHQHIQIHKFVILNLHGILQFQIYGDCEP